MHVTVMMVVLLFAVQFISSLGFPVFEITVYIPAGGRSSVGLLFQWLLLVTRRQFVCEKVSSCTEYHFCFLCLGLGWALFMSGLL